jgi:putative PIN family toxin of toxin-antitoxin system
MKSIVLDTNIIISAAISPNGISAQIINQSTYDDDIQLFYNSTILAEYAEVLSRKKFDIPSHLKDEILNAILETGIIHEPPTSSIPMPDETDRIFYDTAKTSGAILVTGNMRHYPDEPFIMKPAEYWKSMTDDIKLA